MSDIIREQISAMLQENNITFEAFYQGKQTRDKWECFAWLCKFSITAGKSESFEFYTGLAHVQKAKHPKQSARWYEEPEPTKPHAADVLYSLVLDASACSESFEEWCANLGYDTDSRKALETYLLCQTNAGKIRNILGNTLLSKIDEVLQDY